jgi:hypothetical protein
VTTMAHPSKRVTAASMKPYEGQFFVFERPLRPDGVRGDDARMQLLAVGEDEMVFLLLGQPPLEQGLHRLAHWEFEDVEMELESVIVPRRERQDPVGMYYRAALE